MTDEITVIKVSGHEIDDPDFLAALAETVRDLNTPTIIVHGGGKEISALQTAMGITPQFIDGVRVTDETSLSIVEMVISGVINKRLVRALIHAGIEAMGISGSDRGLLKAVKYPHPTQDMMFTGEIKSVRAEVLNALLAEGITPVIAPVCMDEDATTAYNVNADHVAGAIAAAVQADRIVFLSNVEGVLADGERITYLDAEGTQKLIDAGIISGGMIPKVRTALEVLERGVPQAVITNLTGLGSHSGTVFSKNPLSV